MSLDPKLELDCDARGSSLGRHKERRGALLDFLVFAVAQIVDRPEFLRISRDFATDSSLAMGSSVALTPDSAPQNGGLA